MKGEQQLEEIFFIIRQIFVQTFKQRRKLVNTLAPFIAQGNADIVTHQQQSTVKLSDKLNGLKDYLLATGVEKFEEIEQLFVNFEKDVKIQLEHDFVLHQNVSLSKIYFLF